jgi:hypothetical protein
MTSELAAELGVKVSTSASAQARAAATLGCKKAIVVQPYAATEIDRIAGYGRQWVAGAVRTVMLRSTPVPVDSCYYRRNASKMTDANCGCIFSNWKRS